MEQDRGGRIEGESGAEPFGEESLPLSLGIEEASVEFHADGRFRVVDRGGEDVEMLPGAVPVAGEAQEFEKEDAASGVVRPIFKVGGEGLDRRVESAFAEQLRGEHWRVPSNVVIDRSVGPGPIVLTILWDGSAVGEARPRERVRDFLDGVCREAL